MRKRIYLREKKKEGKKNSLMCTHNQKNKCLFHIEYSSNKKLVAQAQRTIIIQTDPIISHEKLSFNRTFIFSFVFYKNKNIILSIMCGQCNQWLLVQIYKKKRSIQRCVVIDIKIYFAMYSGGYYTFLNKKKERINIRTRVQNIMNY